MAKTEERQREALSVEEFKARAESWLEDNALKRGTEEGDRIARSVGELGSEATVDYLDWARTFQAKVHDAGFAGITIPVEYGGQGLTPAHQAAWSQASEPYVMPAVNGLGNSLFIPTMLAHGTEDQKKEWVPAVLRNEKIFCQLFSEPGAGSDLAGVQSKAERHGDEWVLNGQKVWTSGAQVADFGGGPFRTDADVPKHRGLTFFMVDFHQPGVEVRPLKQITGDAQFNEVFFTDAQAPDAFVLGDVNDGWRVALTMLMNERMALGGGGAAPRRRGTEGIVKLAQNTGTWDDPELRDEVMNVVVHQRILALLGQRMRVEAQSKPPGPEFSMMKLMGTRVNAMQTELGTRLAGPAGVAWDDHGAIGQRWSQALLQSRSGKIAGGTDEVMLNILGERVLGLPQEPRPDKNVPFRELKVGTVKS